MDILNESRKKLWPTWPGLNPLEPYKQLGTQILLEHSPSNSEAGSEKVEFSRQGVFPDLKLFFHKTFSDEYL